MFITFVRWRLSVGIIKFYLLTYLAHHVAILVARESINFW